MPRDHPMEPAVLTDDEKSQLLSLANSRSLPHGLVQRAQIVLACARGEANASIARRMGVSNATVGKWRKRYRMQGTEGLHDEPRSGRPRIHDEERVAEVIKQLGAGLRWTSGLSGTMLRLSKMRSFTRVRLLSSFG